MSNAGKLYIGGIACAGLAVLLAACFHWASADPLRFAIYFLLTAVASGMKVSLPGVTGTFSVSFILILSAVIQFSLGEVSAIAVISALIQCFWQAKQRPRPVHVLFNTGLMVLSTAGAYAAYHAWPRHISAVLSIGAATCTYFFTNTFSVAGVIAVTEGKRIFQVWKKTYLWSFPYYLLGASIAASMSYITKLNWELTLALLPMLFIVFRSYSLHLRQLEEEKRTMETVAALHLRTIETLALAIEAKDQTTADHLKRVQIYSSELAKDLSLPPDQNKALQAASILHDVGKIAVPDYIISKPGRLTRDEFARMKVHPIVGAEITERIEFPYPVAPIVRAHHEKWDGSGYPFGLAGDEIPIGARILSVVDCFDALASDRQYRKALPLDAAMAVVQCESGKSFDPQVVELLARRYMEIEAMAQAKPSREEPKLSVDVKVTRGDSPDAGFEGARSRGEAPVPAKDSGQASDAPTPAEAFDEFTSTLGLSLNARETLGVMCSRVIDLVPADAISVYLLEGRWLTPKYVHGENFKLISGLRIELGEGLAGWVAENHQAILNGNPAVEPGYRSGPNGACILNSVLALPLKMASGTIGVLALYRTEKDGFSREDLQALLSIGDKISLAVESSLQQQQRRSNVNIDATTGLPSARALFSSIAAEIAKRRADNAVMTILVCGLEGVATLHETFGRDAAEKALRIVTARLRQTCREVDYLAWRGDEEFVFVLPGLAGEAVAARVHALQRIVRDIGVENWASDLLALSAGSAEFPADGDAPETLVGQAEQRMLAGQRAKMGLGADRTLDSLERLTQSMIQNKSWMPQGAQPESPESPPQSAVIGSW